MSSADVKGYREAGETPSRGVNSQNAIYRAVTYGSVCVPRSVIDAGVFVLQPEVAEPRVLAVVDEQLGGRVGPCCTAHGSD